MEKEPQKTNEGYLHDGFVLYTDMHKTFKRLTPEDVYDLMDMIFAFAENGEVQDSEHQSANIVFDMIKPLLISNWARRKNQEVINTHNAIIKCLKEGKTLKKESIDFLKEHGYLTEVYLKGRGIDESVIKNVLANASNR